MGGAAGVEKLPFSLPLSLPGAQWPRNLGAAASTGLGDLTWALGFGTMARAEERWGPRTSGWG